MACSAPSTVSTGPRLIPEQPTAWNGWGVLAAKRFEDAQRVRPGDRARRYASPIQPELYVIAPERLRRRPAGSQACIGLDPFYGAETRALIDLEHEDPQLELAPEVAGGGVIPVSAFVLGQRPRPVRRPGDRGRRRGRRRGAYQRVMRSPQAITTAPSPGRRPRRRCAARGSLVAWEIFLARGAGRGVGRFREARIGQRLCRVRGNARAHPLRRFKEAAPAEWLHERRGQRGFAAARRPGAAGDRASRGLPRDAPRRAPARSLARGRHLSR
jgi:hypothetical protein